jgi:formate dehydrogenase major subunit
MKAYLFNDVKPASRSAVVAQKKPAVKETDSLCPYCGVGCALTFVVDQEKNRILYTRGRDGAPNAGRLCVKGRYGFDYAMHEQRLTTPLIRRAATPKAFPPWAERRRKHEPGGRVDYNEILPHFREAGWDEALDLVAARLKQIRDTHGGDALAGFGSAKGSNEEAYLFQKLVRVAFGTNNVDHCTRLCHASVAALQEASLRRGDQRRARCRMPTLRS